jgi:hypothetical protein
MPKITPIAKYGDGITEFFIGSIALRLNRIGNIKAMTDNVEFLEH